MKFFNKGIYIVMSIFLLLFVALTIGILFSDEESKIIVIIPIFLSCMILNNFYFWLFRKDSVWYHEYKYCDAKSFTRTDFDNVILYTRDNNAIPFPIKYKNRNYKEFQLEYMYNRKKELLYYILNPMGNHKYEVIE